MEAREVLPVSDGIINDGRIRLICCRMEFGHVLVKLSPVERPGISMRVNAVVSGRAEQKCFRPLPILTCNFP